MDPLDRKLSEIDGRLQGAAERDAKLSERIARLERRKAHEDRDITEGRRLAIAALKLLLRRLESE